MMHRDNPITLFLLTAGFLFFLGSCTFQQEYTIRRDLSGELSFEVTTEDLLVSAMEDLMLFSTPQGGTKALDFLSPQMLRQQWGSIESSRLDQVSRQNRNNLTGRVTFDNLNRLFSPESGFTGSPALDISREEGLTRIHFHLSRNNYSTIAETTPLLREPVFALFGPEANEQSSREEYFEMVETFLGDQGPAALEASWVSIVLKTEGPITQSEGIEVTGNRRAVFKRPLLDFLLLEEPLEFTLVFR